MTTLSSQTRSVWAKSYPQGVSDDRLVGWMPLWQHLAEASAVAGRLWDSWVARSVTELIGSALPGGPDDGRILLSFLAGVHDVGKATPAFAQQVSAFAHDIAAAGLPYLFTQPQSRPRHDLVGMLILDRWLSDTYGIQRSNAEQFSVIVGGHHGAPPDSRDLPEIASLPEFRWASDPAWKAVQDELLAWQAERTGADRRFPDWSEIRLEQPAQVLLTSLVVMADWVASNQSFFGLASIGRQPRFSDTTELRRLDDAWGALALPPRWEPTDPPLESLFKQRFPSLGPSPRPVQEAAVRIATMMDPHGLLIVEAPMGEGKTEAAFLSAEVLAARCGASGVYVALPTQATANSMFTRTLEWVDQLDAGIHTVNLTHGRAELFDAYAALRQPWRANVGADGNLADSSDPKSRANPPESAIVNQWLAGRHRAGLADFVVGTIDQVLMSALKSKFVAMRHLALDGKVVVLDEVHAIDAYMSVYLERALEWLGSAGTPVIMLSATLPAPLRNRLMDAYERGKQARTSKQAAVREAAIPNELVEPTAYPLITASGSGDSHLVESLKPSGRSSEVSIQYLQEGIQPLAAHLETLLANGGCALVLHNTVRRVQATAESLRGILGTDAVEIAHASFLAIDRVRRDAALVEEFGKEATRANGRRPERKVLVATQVVEQSLDVDFDVIITDIAPVDLVMQRLGRLHRHSRDADRPARLSHPTAFITGYSMTDAGPEFARGIDRVYSRGLLIRSLAALLPMFEHDRKLRLPNDVPILVDQVYSDLTSADAIVVPEGWDEMDKDAQLRFRKEQMTKRKNAQTFLLPNVQKPGKPIIGWLRANVGSVDETEQGSRQVRDSGDSIEVIVVQSDQFGQLRIPDWIDDPLAGQIVPTNQVPSDAESLCLAKCAQRLPTILSEWHFDDVVRDLEANWIPGWQQDRRLRGQLILILDDDRMAEVADFELNYSPTDGLKVTST